LSYELCYSAGLNSGKGNSCTLGVSFTSDQAGRQLTNVKSIDASAWTARSQEVVLLAQGRTVAVWQTYARDADRLARLQGSLILLLGLWALWNVSQLLWMPFRGGEIETAPSMALNPPALSSPRESAIIDVSAVLGSGLFGGEPDTLAAEAEVASGIESDREGIEQNAKETRLALQLTGIVASTDDGLGNAVIKAGAKEQVYAVGDALPASGRVTLAKVMPTQVVIDNNGTYELIKLYDGPGLVIPTRAAPAPISETSLAMAAAPDTSANTLGSAEERNALAGQYRQRLYDNPESLADAVSVAPVRAGNQIVGYRIAPGADAQAFDTFGFKRGDVVVAVNGLALSDASNTLKLYQLMKEATQATFDIERDGGTVTISVDLASP